MNSFFIMSMQSETPPTVDSTIPFRDDENFIGGSYFLAVLLIFVIFIVVVVFNEKLKRFISKFNLNSSVQCDRRIVVKERTRISSKSIIISCEVDGNSFVVIESTASSVVVANTSHRLPSLHKDEIEGG